MVNPGEFDTLVMVRRCTITRDGQGAKTYTFSDYGKVWAKVEREFDESVIDSNLSDGDVIRATMYKIDGITTRWQVQVGEVKYSIAAMDPMERISHFMTLTLKADE